MRLGIEKIPFGDIKKLQGYQDSIRTCSRFTDETGEKEDDHYYSIEDTENEITEEEYEAIRSSYIEDMEEYRVYQKWVEFTDAEISAEQIGRKLLTSYLGSR